MATANVDKRNATERARRQRPEVKALRAKRAVWERAWSRFRLRPHDIERMFADQGGKCAGCGDEITLIRGTINYRNVDHNHAKKLGDPNFIRGLLCRECNWAAGHLHDSPARCRSLADYLERRG